uniref:Uncharacterized protein n=1 Tax=Prolemur simus TaxID=1328070 RepID=A0A8C8YVG3_PROSS
MLISTSFGGYAPWASPLDQLQRSQPIQELPSFMSLIMVQERRDSAWNVQNQDSSGSTIWELERDLFYHVQLREMP